MSAYCTFFVAYKMKKQLKYYILFLVSLITFATYANTVQVGNWDVYSRNEYQQLIAQSEPDYYKLGM
ncbi:hypothetical protein MNBD_GAMMA01-2246, partial [hydrothermal vent metagenome]